MAYTWFKAVYMEVNEESCSEKEGKNEPDVVTMAPDIDWDFTDKEREEILMPK